LHEALKASAVLYHGDLEAYISADLVFHKRLVDAAHNPALSELYQYFSAIVGAQLRQTLNISPRRQAVFDLHIALLDAVEHQDPERAKSLCRQLINEP
jgi:DNA-binding FadR family transcriptional regulator